MSECCEKCGRTIHGGPLTGFAEGLCTLPGGPICKAIADGRRRGMREGVEIAKADATIEHAHRAGCREYACGGCGAIDWSDVDAELARRCGDAE